MDRVKLKISDIRAVHIGKDIAIDARVVKVSTQRPAYTKAVFLCPICGHLNVCEQEINEPLTHPTRCYNETCNSKKPVFSIVDEDCTIIDIQEILVTEEIEVKGGTRRRDLRVLLIGDPVGKTLEELDYTFEGTLHTVTATQSIPEYILYATKLIQIQNQIDENRIEILKDIIKSVSCRHSNRNAPLHEVYGYAVQIHGIPSESVQELMEELKQRGDVRFPTNERVELIPEDEKWFL